MPLSSPAWNLSPPIDMNHSTIPDILEQIRQRHAALSQPGASMGKERSPVSAFLPTSSTSRSALAAYLRSHGVQEEVGDELVESVSELQHSAGSLEDELILAESVLKRRWHSTLPGNGAGETH